MPYKDREKQREAGKAHYERNRAKVIERSAVWNKAQGVKIRQFIAEYLSEHPCVDCREADLIVLEFDHRSDKRFNIADALSRKYGIETIRAEIVKCDVRCANCHRRKTHRDRIAFLK